MRTFICAFLYLIFILAVIGVEIGGVTFAFTQISLIAKVFVCVCSFFMGAGIFMAIMQDLREII